MSKSILVLLLLASTACTVESGPEAEQVASHESNIIEGRATTGDPAVVAIYTSEPYVGTSSLCTGSIVAPTVVLTAAHCVHPKNLGSPFARSVVVTHPNVIEIVPPSSILAVKSVRWDPDYNPADVTAGHDIAIVELAAPTKIAPLPVNLHRLPDALDTPAYGMREAFPVRIVGYGALRGEPSSGSGVKRTGDAYLTEVTSDLVGSFGVQRLCNGDSGGPTLARINGIDTVIAVTSYGQTGCGGVAYSTRVDAYGSFLRAYLPRVSRAGSE